MGSFRAAIGALLLGLCLVPVAPAHARKPKLSPVFTFEDLAATGWSQLVRHKRGVRMNLHTTGLRDGDAVTVWWVVFNNPDACVAGAAGFPFRCGEADLLDPAVRASVLYATGKVVGRRGDVTFGDALTMRDMEGALFGPGLTNPMGADIHLILRSHGKADKQFMPEQLRYFDACPDGCVDLQASVHQL